ncbi:MAG: hypothetical protein ABIK43_03180 [candidate division WOR-3 bacterium]
MTAIRPNPRIPRPIPNVDDGKVPIAQGGAFTLGSVGPSSVFVGDEYHGTPLAGSLWLDTDESAIMQPPAGVGSGTAFPENPEPGQLFYRTDIGRLFVYAGSVWSEYPSSDIIGDVVRPLGCIVKKYESDILQPAVYARSVTDAWGCNAVVTGNWDDTQSVGGGYVSFVNGSPGDAFLLVGVEPSSVTGDVFNIRVRTSGQIWAGTIVWDGESVDSVSLTDFVYYEVGGSYWREISLSTAGWEPDPIYGLLWFEIDSFSNIPVDIDAMGLISRGGFPDNPEQGTRVYFTDKEALFVYVDDEWRVDKCNVLEVWYDSVNGSDSNDGLEQSRPVKSPKALWRRFGNCDAIRVVANGVLNLTSYGANDTYAYRIPQIVEIVGESADNKCKLYSFSSIGGLRYLYMLYVEVDENSVIQADLLRMYRCSVYGSTIKANFMWIFDSEFYPAYGQPSIISDGHIDSISRSTASSSLSGIPAIVFQRVTFTQYFDFDADGNGVAPCIEFRYCKGDLSEYTNIICRNGTVGIIPTYAEIHGAGNVTYINCDVDYANTMFGTVD